MIILDALEPALHAMGQRHTAYGVRPEHYDTVGQAMLWAFSQALAGDFDREHQSAMGRVFELVSAGMKDGAAALTDSPENL